jgi:DNA mismatch endonuclease (patch repair protein)
MRANKGRDTLPERRLRSHLHRLGLRFRKHARPLPALRCTADVLFPRQRVAVFVDGCFWHGCPEHGRVPRSNRAYWEPKLARNVERDRRNDRALSEAGRSCVPGSTSPWRMSPLASSRPWPALRAGERTVRSCHGWRPLQTMLMTG